MKRRTKLSVQPNISRRKPSEKASVKPKDADSALKAPNESDKSIGEKNGTIEVSVQNDKTVVVPVTNNEINQILVAEDKLNEITNKNDEADKVVEKNVEPNPEKLKIQESLNNQESFATANIDANVADTENKLFGKNAEKCSTTDATPKSPSKTPLLAMRLNSRLRLPKPRPNIENSERHRVKRCSMSESEDETNRHQNPSGPRRRNPSGPPPLQNVLRISETQSKALIPADGGKDISLAEQIRDDRLVDAQRKRHRSALNEVDDLRRRKKLFYKKGNKPPEKSKMTMLDLIYWNPTSNPMVNESVNEAEIQSAYERRMDFDIDQQSRLEEEAVDEPENQGDENDDVPVPQIKIGPDGNIIVDEKTLIVPPAEINRENLENNPILYEKSSTTTYSSFKRKGNRLKKWTAKETAKFYQALCTVGTDFSMMTQLFPNRTRVELKKKFTKEDRVHKDLVDQAINNSELFDMELLDVSDSDEEKRKKVIKKPKVRKIQKNWRRRPTYEWTESENEEPADEGTVDNADMDDSTDPTFKCIQDASKEDLKIICQRSKREQKKLYVKSPQPQETEFSKMCSTIIDASQQPVADSLNSTTPSKTVFKNLSETNVIVPQSPNETTSNPAQLFLVAQKSSDEQEQIIHVYMVSPATSGNPSDANIPVIPQVMPGITLLSNSQSSNASVSEENTSVSLSDQPIESEDYVKKVVHTEIIIDGESK